MPRVPLPLSSIPKSKPDPDRGSGPAASGPATSGPAAADPSLAADPGLAAAPPGLGTGPPGVAGKDNSAIIIFDQPGDQAVGENQKRVFQLWEIVMEGVKATVPLLIDLSSVKGVKAVCGSGLFTSQALGAKTDIFRSQPMVTTKNIELEDVCDYCFADARGKLHTHGYFLGHMDKNPVVIKTCSKCGTGRYCSKICQTKAWENFHKYECKLLPDKFPCMSELALAFYRILILQKEGKISKEKWLAIGGLGAPYNKVKDAIRHQDVFKTTVEAARVIGDLEYDNLVHQNLLCRLFTHGKPMTRAYNPSGVSVGYSFDLTVAMINHSCDPNAFLYFEGNEARVRSLRKIPAGEEILISYVDPSMSVFRRREKLRDEHFFECGCRRCNHEAAVVAHAAGVGNFMKRATQLLSSQTDLGRALAHIEPAFPQSWYTALGTVAPALPPLGPWTVIPRSELLPKFLAEVTNITKATYPDGFWPRHVDPMPRVRMVVMEMYLDRGELLPALAHGLQGCLTNLHRKTPTWMDDVFRVCRILHMLVGQPKDSFMYDNRGFPACSELRLFFTGLLQILAVEAEALFGRDSRFTYSLQNFAAAYQNPLNQPSVTSLKFKTRFDAAQHKLLNWAQLVSADFGSIQAVHRNAAVARQASALEFEWGVKRKAEKAPKKSKS